MADSQAMSTHLIKKAYVLAAGFATRARPLSALKAKALFPIWGRPLLFHILDKLLSLKVEQIFVNACYLAWQIEKALKEYPQNNAEIIFLPEKEILGTGGSLVKARDFFKNNSFYVINADIYSDLDLSALANEHLSKNAQVTMALLDKPEKANVSIDENKKIIAFRSPIPVKRELYRHFYSGQMIVNSEILSHEKNGHSDIIKIFQKHLKDGAQMIAHQSKYTYWYDAGTPYDYWRLHQETALNHTLNKTKNWLAISPNAEISKTAQVENSILWSEAKVTSNITLKNAIIFGDLSKNPQAYLSFLT